MTDPQRGPLSHSLNTSLSTSFSAVNDVNGSSHVSNRDGLMVGQSEWRSILTLGFAARQQKTRLVKRQHCGALQVQRALYPEPFSKTAANINNVNQSGICHTILLYPPAGIAAGDKLKITIELAKDSHAVLTTPGAGKWYGKEAVEAAHTNNIDNKQAATNFASQHITAVVEEGATLEWLPQESIVFNHANMQASARFDLAASSSLLTWDIVVFGRQAYQEVFESGQYRNELAIYRNGKLIVFENSNHAASSRWFISPLAMNGQHIMGTFWAVPAGDTSVEAIGGQLKQTIAALRESIDCEQLGVVCTQTEQAICIRYLGDDIQACFAAFSKLRQVLRQQWWQLTPHKPRIWDT